LSLQCPRILVVNDDPDMRVFLTTVLTAGGFEPVVAVDGSEGLRLACTCKPALILIEAHLPGQPGVDVYRQIKQDPDLCAIPVIMLSLLSPKTYLHCRQIEDGRQGERLPAPEAFLAKPPEAEDLLRRVRRLLGETTDGADSGEDKAAGPLPALRPLTARSVS